MAIANPRIHMICGICGNNKSFSFSIDLKGNCDENGDEYPSVSIYCSNCNSLSGLDDIIPEERENENT